MDTADALPYRRKKKRFDDGLEKRGEEMGQKREEARRVTWATSGAPGCHALAWNFPI